MERKDSERTRRLKESKIEDDFLGIKKGARYGFTKLSEGMDRLGFTGEKKEKEPVKKAKGGMISNERKTSMKKMAMGGMAPSKMGKVKTAAPSRDGVATKGKTRGTMVKMAGSTGMKKGGMAKESTAKMDSRAEKAGRKVTKDIEYDDKMDRMRKMMKGGMTKMRYGGKC